MALFTSKPREPKLHPGQETIDAAQERLGLTDTQFEAARSTLGFPNGSLMLVDNLADPTPQCVRIVKVQAVDEWVSAVKTIAAELK